MSDFPLPANLEQGVERIADHLIESVIVRMFGSPLLAYYALDNSPSVDATPFLLQAKKWTRKYINDLPDAAFAVIEPDYSSGSTTDKNARHLPHHDASVKSAAENSSVDIPHLRNALARVNQLKPITQTSKDSLISKARSHLQKHAKALGVGDDEKKEASSMNRRLAMDETTPDAPTQPYGFPRTAPPPEGEAYQFPGQGPPANTDTEKENDATVLTKNAPAPHYTPPGDQLDTPPAPSDQSTQEIDQITFPSSTGTPYTGPEQSTDLNLLVTPGRQTPETERHQVYQRQQRQGKPGGPRPPWERSTMDIYSSDDGHLDGVEKTAQEVDLYHRRHGRRQAMKDLTVMGERFLAERTAMESMVGCTAHLDAPRAYSKEIFAYSYGQMRLSLSRAMKSFVVGDDDPDLQTYHSLLAMRADLLGETSRKLFADAQLPVEIASMTDGSGMMPDPDDPNDPNNNEEMVHGKDQKSEGDDDMKDTDMAEAMDISLRMYEAGMLANREAVKEKALRLAHMDPVARRELAQALPAPGQVAVPRSTSTQPSGMGMQVANQNLVPSGVTEMAGQQSRVERASAGMFGLFMGGPKAPIFNQQ